jgi:outer membrane receptor protein involved in Fe transport
MRKVELRSFASLTAIALLSLATPAYAQDDGAADPAAEEADEFEGLDAIVVTASPGNRSQIDSAISVTSVDAEIINDFKPSSEAEVFRLIPGIQVAGTSGPGGNSNIAVRGLPVATGGSPFVQIQEDGLPTVLFGDIQFGNNDYWTRFDPSVERLESVRGGGAATFTSQAPGAVINYISNTGREAGGFVGVSAGVNFNEQKLEFRYGAPISDMTRFHVGGYYKTGHGPLNNFKTSDSMQIKGNFTADIGEKGYIRLLLKYANTQEPNYTGSPALATRTGNKISNIRPFPGFDGREDSNYSSLNRTGLFLNRSGVLEREALDGISTKQFSLGGQFHYEIGDNITIDNNFRWADMSGSFASPFLNVGRTANTAVVPVGFTSCTAPAPFSSNGVLGSCVNGQVVAAIRYASGDRSGQLYTGTYLDNNVNVRTNIRDIGSLANNLTIAGNFDTGGITFSPRAGFFYMDQTIAMDWHVNKSLRELSGNNPAQLNLFNAAGARITNEGISGYNNNWGDCCARDYDLSYTNTAPYVSLDLDSDLFALDASVRFERIRAKGGGTQGGAEIATVANNPGGLNIPFILSNSPREIVNYSRSYKSWTAGALFKATSDLSIFARASRGGRFNGDRQTFGNKFHKTGSTIGALCTSDQTELRNAANVVTRAAQFGCGADGVTPSVDFVTQYEIGVKNRGNIGSGRYTFELSLLKGDFKQSTFELSATRCPGGAGGCVIDAKFKSTGAEFYGTLQFGDFNFVANATYSNAKRAGAGSNVFVRSPGIADLTYTMAANYDFGDIASFGLNVSGQTSQVDDGQLEYPGGNIFGANLRVSPIKNLDLGLQVYNLFNKFDFRGNGGISDGTVTPIVVGGAPAIGRTITASVRYNF